MKPSAAFVALYVLTAALAVSGCAMVREQSGPAADTFENPSVMRPADHTF